MSTVPKRKAKINRKETTNQMRTSDQDQNSNSKENQRQDANKKGSVKPAYKKSTYTPSKDASAIFRSVPSELFLQLNDIIDASLVDGVSSLPFLPTSQQTVKFSLKNISDFLGVDSNTKDKEGTVAKLDEEEDEAGDYKFLKSLRAAYAKNIDKAEIYALRNIFTIEELPRSKRIQLVQAIQMNVDVDELDATLNSECDNYEGEKINGKKEDEDEKEEQPLPALPKSTNEIPTETDILNVEDDLDQLRIKILEKRQRRNILVSQLAEMNQVAKTVRQANSVIQSSMKEMTSSNKEIEDKSIASGTIKDLVGDVMIGKKGLEELQQQGTDLMKRLDEIKKLNGSNDDDYLNEFLLKVKKKRNQLSLDDHFAAMKKRLPGVSNVDMEGALGNLRKKKKHKNI